jgi:hypothetical protein
VPDPIVAPLDASPADSSPAPDPTPDRSDPTAGLTDGEAHAWRMTGKLPASSPVTDAAAASSPAEPAAPVASTDARPEAASEPAAPLGKGEAARVPELLRDRAQEREARLRAEARLAELEARTAQPPPDARPAASSPAPAGLVAPDPETYTYGTADPEYLKALTAHTVATTLATERANWDEGQRQARARDETTRVITAFEGKVTEARTKHPDFDAVALMAPTEIPQGSAVDLFVLEDPAGAELLYHLQQPANAAERRRILKLAPLDQLKELVRLGDRLTGPAPAPRSTSAPAPAPVLGSRATPVDAVERAIRDDDTDAYNREMNARDLAKLKGK